MQFSTIGMIAFADVPREEISSANGLFNTLSQLSSGAGVALGAISVRAGHLIAGAFGLRAAGIDFRLAFLLVAALALLSLLDPLALPRGAGDEFAARAR